MNTKCNYRKVPWLSVPVSDFNCISPIQIKTKRTEGLIFNATDVPQLALGGIDGEVFNVKLVLTEG